MDYSYEGDTKSVAGKSVHVETTFPKLKWPEDIEELESDEGIVKKSDNDAVHCKKEFLKKNERSKSDDDVSMEEGDEFDEDDLGRDPIRMESDGEDLPVLPKVPMKQKLLNEQKTSEKKTHRGRAKSTSPQIKENKTPQIDASVITQLEFRSRPANFVSILSMCL